MTKKQAANRVAFLRKYLLTLHKEAVTVHLNIHNSCGRRYQIALIDITGNEITSLPRNYHLKARDFDCYLLALEEVAYLKYAGGVR